MLGKLDMNVELKIYLPLNQVNLNRHDRNPVAGVADGDYFLQTSGTSLWNTIRINDLFYLRVYLTQFRQLNFTWRQTFRKLLRSF